MGGFFYEEKISFSDGSNNGNHILEKLLPVSMPINSYMWTGDKFSTWYSGVYEIAIEGDMTKEYAEELAKKFAR